MASHAITFERAARGGPTTLSTVTPPDSSEGGAPPAPLSDEQLLGRGTSLSRYIVVRHLSTGGQGVVYEAYDPDLVRRLAVKVLRTDVGKGNADDRRTALLREAREHARLEHPNVVRIHDVGTTSDQLFLAMQYMERGTLKDWLAQPRSAREVLARFVEAGRAAHAVGLVHRDFKADNVLLGENDVAHVTDFGLAHRGEAVSGAGTTRYMSPEQHARNEVVSAASDQFSFCMALCEALTGEVPERTPTAMKLPANKPLPPWVRPVLVRGLTLKPGDRFPSMDALLAALEAGPEARQRLISRALFALVVAAVALAVGWGLTRESPTEREQRECLSRVKGTESEVWGPERLAKIDQRFSSVAGSIGHEDFGRVKNLMGPEVSAWTDATSQACLFPVSAAHARCLESRGRVLQSLSDLFVDAEAKAVNQALNTVQLEVLPVTGCLSTSVINPRVVPESEPDQRLRPNLARARVLRTAGEYDEAIVAAMGVVEQAHAQGAVRVEAEAQLLAGKIYSDLRRADTESVLLKAVLLAEQASADEERALAWMVLITWYASHDNFEAATAARAEADSILVRLGRPDHLEVQYQGQLAQLFSLQGDQHEAALASKRSLDLRRRHYGDLHPLVSRALNNYALTLDAQQARPLLQKVLDGRAASFGEQHPETAIAAHNLGEMIKELDCSEALPQFRRALSIWEGQATPDTCRLAREHFAISRAYECMTPTDPWWRDELHRAFDEEASGLNLILRLDCAQSLSIEQELRWLSELSTRLDRPAFERHQLHVLIDLVHKKEPLPPTLELL